MEANKKKHEAFYSVIHLLEHYECQQRAPDIGVFTEQGLQRLCLKGVYSIRQKQQYMGLGVPDTKGLIE